MHSLELAQTPVASPAASSGRSGPVWFPRLSDKSLIGNVRMEWNGAGHRGGGNRLEVRFESVIYNGGLVCNPYNTRAHVVSGTSFPAWVRECGHRS